MAERLRAELERLEALAPRLDPPTRASSPLLIALSGGGDSTALLCLALEAGLHVVAAHLDHGLRADSAQGTHFVEALCTKFDVPLEVERVDIRSVARVQRRSLEDAARRVRYGFLTKAARKFGARSVLTAHTQDDDIETVLYQLLRGTGRATGIPARRDRILRPLLWVRRSELRDHLNRLGQPWYEDVTNLDRSITRNWLRLEVLPLLETRFAAHNTLARYLRISRDEDVFLEDLTSAVPDWADWRHEPPALQRRLIRRLLEGKTLPPDALHIESLLEALSIGGTRRVSLAKNHIALVRRGRIEIFPPKNMQAHLDESEEEQKQKDRPKYPDFDFSSIPNAVLRTRRAGDRITLSGGRRKLSDVLIDLGVPRERRDRLSVLAVDAEVLWLGVTPPLVSKRLRECLEPVGGERFLDEVDLAAGRFSLGRFSGQGLDEQLMERALALAREAARLGEVPVGAVVVRAQNEEIEVLGRGHNRSRLQQDMTRHAELEALREACERKASPYLDDCTLVVTLEPCPMCFGAALEARISRLVFGAKNPKAGALGGVLDLSRAAWTHRMQITPGVSARACAHVLETFFDELRSADSTHQDTTRPDAKSSG